MAANPFSKREICVCLCGVVDWPLFYNHRLYRSVPHLLSRYALGVPDKIFLPKLLQCPGEGITLDWIPSSASAGKWAKSQRKTSAFAIISLAAISAPVIPDYYSGSFARNTL